MCPAGCAARLISYRDVHRAFAPALLLEWQNRASLPQYAPSEDANMIKALFLARDNGNAVMGYTNSQCKIEWMDY